MQRVIFFDVDGTLISENTWDILFTHPELAGAKKQVYRKILPIWLAAKLRLVDDGRFRDRWVQVIGDTFKGWPQEKLDQLFDWTVHEQRGQRYRQDVVARLKAHLDGGDHVVLVSGMYTGIVQRFAQELGAHAGVGTWLEFANGVCLGSAAGHGCVGPHKLTYIQDYLKTSGREADLQLSSAYADSGSDIPLLSAVGHAVATYPDDTLRRHALAHDWEVLPADAAERS